MGEKAKVICFSNHKGGVGKSCSACNIGVGLSRKERRVLIVDLDPQANLTLSLGIKDVEKSIYHALIGECKLSEITYPVNRYLHIVPSNLDLSGAEIELSSESGRELILKELLGPELENYDYIIIDCPPSLGLLTLNALTASTDVIIPLQAQFLACQGLTKQHEVIEKIKSRLNRSLKILGIIITQFDGRKVLSRDVESFIRDQFDDLVFKTCVRDTVALAEAPGMGKDIFRYKPNSRGASDYADLCDEVIVRLEGQRVLSSVK